VAKENKKGVLYIIPTPIGNLKDITLRALDVLASVDLIACEDTRTAGMLLKLLGLPKKDFISYYDSVEESKSDLVLEKLLAGLNVGLISESGTPLISDPGYKLVQKCIDLGIEIVSLPGATAFVPALVISGLPVHNFKFFGFPPKKKGYKKFLEKVANEESTSVVYVSCHSLLKFLEDLIAFVGETRKICLVRELTKMNEEVLRGSLGEVFRELSQNRSKIRGEIVLIIEGKVG
jgi:16S rRNA (cytidine1402-2'-O)-methyltransferase